MSDNDSPTEWPTMATALSGSTYDYPDPWAHDKGFTVRWTVMAGVFVASIVLNSFLAMVLWRDRKHFSRINLVVFHLMISDLLITFFNIPVDIIWVHTKAFLAGVQACKVIAFLRRASLYSSSFIVVVISLDRCFAIVRPLSVHQADIRCKMLLTIAWVASFVCSIPEYIVYTIESPHFDPTFTQCVDKNMLSTSTEIWNLYFSYQFLLHYVLPFVVMLGCYGAILIKICSRGRRCCLPTKQAIIVFRKSSGDAIPRARKKVMRLTIALAVTFLICWSPYYAIELWYHLQRDEWHAQKYPPLLNESFYALSYVNVCLDPIMYGFFNIKLCQRCSDHQRRAHRSVGYEKVRMKFVLPTWRSKQSGSGSGKGSNTERIS